MTLSLNKLGAALAALLLATGAHAHYLWIDDANGEARMYFGEPDVLLKEKSPGKLDSIKAPKAWVANGKDGKASSTAITRGADSFSIASDPAASAIMVLEESLEVRDMTKSGLGMAKSNYYARHGRAPGGSSAMTLDVEERGSNQFAVLYRGQPLPHAKVEVIAPNTWVQIHDADANGVVRVNTPWRGKYVLHILHVEKQAGKFNGQPYDALRNHFTYGFARNDGADAGPAIAPQVAKE